MNKEQQELLDEVYENYRNAFIEGHIHEELDKCLSKEEFIEEIKTDSEFSEKWGLKIEERELSLEERCELGYKYVDSFEWDMLMGGGREGDEGNCNDYYIPTKLITIIHKDNIIESYER